MSAELGGLPSTIVLSASHISLYHQFSISDSVEILRRQQRSLDEACTSTGKTIRTLDNQMEHELTFEPLWDVALRTVSSEGRELLNMIALLSPAGAQESFYFGDIHKAMPSLNRQSQFRHVTFVKLST